MDISPSSVFNSGIIQKYRSGRAVEQEGEFERILGCNQETLDIKEQRPVLFGSLLPVTVTVVLCHVFLM